MYHLQQRPGQQQMPNMANMPNMQGVGRPGPGPQPGMAGNIQQGNVPPGAMGANNMNMGMGKKSRPRSFCLISSCD